MLQALRTFMPEIQQTLFTTVVPWKNKKQKTNKCINRERWRSIVQFIIVSFSNIHLGVLYKRNTIHKLKRKQQQMHNACFNHFRTP